LNAKNGQAPEKDPEPVVTYPLRVGASARNLPTQQFGRHVNAIVTAKPPGGLLPPGSSYTFDLTVPQSLREPHLLISPAYDSISLSCSNRSVGQL